MDQGVEYRSAVDAEQPVVVHAGDEGAAGVEPQAVGAAAVRQVEASRDGRGPITRRGVKHAK